jgi:hypothetical protein
MLKEDVFVSTREIIPETSMARSGTRDGSNGNPDVIPAELPPRPAPVKSSSVSDWIDRVYDAALCLAPICLIVKTGLVIRAHHVDKYSGTGVMNPASPLTENLVYFNGQVRTLIGAVDFQNVLTKSSWSLCSPSYS